VRAAAARAFIEALAGSARVQDTEAPCAATTRPALRPDALEAHGRLDAGAAAEVAAAAMAEIVAPAARTLLHTGDASRGAASTSV
jgi:hypothetical protein